MKLHQEPFEHGLALAWSDGALSRRGAQLLELLQSRLVLSDKQRAEIEELKQKLAERERVHAQNRDLVTKNCGQ